MNYVIELGPRFKKEFKRLTKKYRSLDKDIEKLGNELKKTPAIGIDLGGGVRKICMAISESPSPRRKSPGYWGK